MIIGTFAENDIKTGKPSGNSLCLGKGIDRCQVMLTSKQSAHVPLIIPYGLLRHTLTVAEAPGSLGGTAYSGSTEGVAHGV